MSYTLFDFDIKEIEREDLQDKVSWCKWGEDMEVAFLTKYGYNFGLDINPQKKEKPTVPDFIHVDSNKIVDLKTQNTPFFQANKYGVPPQFAVTFNDNDLDYYKNCYPDIIIIFHVEWLVHKLQFPNGSEKVVSKMEGIWVTTINRIDKECTANNLHEYKQRLNDEKGNAKNSYVLDLRNNIFDKKL